MPKIAVLFNDAKTNPPQDVSLLSSAVDELKKKNVNVFAVGIGENVDRAELNAIASAPENVFHFESHEKIFERLGELTSAICSVHVDIEADTTESISLGTFDVRYFKTDVRKFRNQIVIVEVKELSGRVTIYASTTVKNPTQQTTDFLSRSLSSSSKSTVSYPLYLNDEEFIYFTIISFNQPSQVEIRVKKY